MMKLCQSNDHHSKTKRPYPGLLGRSAGVLVCMPLAVPRIGLPYAFSNRERVGTIVAVDVACSIFNSLPLLPPTLLILLYVFLSFLLSFFRFIFFLSRSFLLSLNGDTNTRYESSRKNGKINAFLFKDGLARTS